MENDNYEYETKCRRCGTFQDWHFSSKSQIKWTAFAMAMDDYIRNPRQHKCETCGKPTIQDVVSYNGCP